MIKLPEICTIVVIKICISGIATCDKSNLVFAEAEEMTVVD